MSTILSAIESPDQVRDLSVEQLTQLASELRGFIIDRVSRNGGHLASNLGTIELTLALLHEFDLTTDKVVWDVGHQSYAYKILTGRREAFSTLRQKGGLSGFPKREESEYDSFNTGHSTTSISAAIGIARGMRLQGKPGKVIAVIGDGALTGGMAYEAMNNISNEDSNLIIILNDNQMSIDRNVGSLSRNFNKIRVAPGYIRMKNRMEIALEKLPLIGRGLSRFVVSIKNKLRRSLQPKNSIFESFGLRQYGPIDGHDFHQLMPYLRAARHQHNPVLLHMMTQKGRGYLLAEDRPDVYHGVAPFVIETGIAPRPELDPLDAMYPMNGCSNFSDAFTMSVMGIAERNSKVVAVTAAMASGTGLLPFATRYPNRFFDVGIAEPHAVTMAAGLATQGLIPIVAIYATFLQRALDQVIHDVVYQGLHVIFSIDRAGIVGADGETHQGLYDRPFLMSLPNVTIFEPRDYLSLKRMLFYAVESCDGPVFIRYPRGLGQCPSEFRSSADPALVPPLPQAEVVRAGTDVTILCAGNMTGFACQASRILEEEGIEVEIVDARCVKPLDIDTVMDSAERTGALLVMEEAVSTGSLALILVDHMKENRVDLPFAHLGVGDHPVHQATQKEAWTDEGLDVDTCCATVRALLKEKQGSTPDLAAVRKQAAGQ